MTNAYASSILHKTLCNASKVLNHHGRSKSQKTMHLKNKWPFIFLFFALLAIAPRVGRAQTYYVNVSTTYDLKNYLASPYNYAITLTANISIDELFVMTTNKTLYMNGKTITRTNRTGCIKVTGGTLTIYGGNSSDPTGNTGTFDGNTSMWGDLPNANLSSSLYYANFPTTPIIWLPRDVTARLNVSNCIFQNLKSIYKGDPDNTIASNGVAIALSNKSGHSTITNCTFRNNAMYSIYIPNVAGGTVLYSEGTEAQKDTGTGAAIGIGGWGNTSYSVTINNCNFYNNWSSLSGGAIFIFGYSISGTNVAINNCNIGVDMTNPSNPVSKPNIALNGNGGGVGIYGPATVTINGTTIANNVAYTVGTINGHGGGLYMSGSSASSSPRVTLEGNTKIYNNTALNGGGAQVRTGILSFSGNSVAIHDNTANQDGGGIYVYTNGTVKCENTASFSITNNNSRDGGGICNCSGTLTLTSRTTKTIQTNTATRNGGGIYIDSNSDAVINVASVTDNTASNNGGGFYICNSSSVDIYDSSVTDNTATSNGGGVYLANGAIADFYGPTADEMTIQNNTAGNFGGGVYIATTAIMGIEGEIIVKDNVSTRTTNNNYSVSAGTGLYQDDVCLQTLNSTSAGNTTIGTGGNVGKIYVNGDIEGSEIGITEQEVASGTNRALGAAGNTIRQFTIAYTQAGGIRGFNKDVFISNDTELKVIILEHNFTDINGGTTYTTTHQTEVTLGAPLGRTWYVAGIVDDDGFTWGKDENGRGVGPDVPLRTLTGPNGLFAQNNFNPVEDRVFVVRAISIEAEAEARSIVSGESVVIRYPYDATYQDFVNGTYLTNFEDKESIEVELFRYPGGFPLSQTYTINSFSFTHDDANDGNHNNYTNYGNMNPPDPTAPQGYRLPGQNIGPLVQMNTSSNPAMLHEVVMDGLRENNAVTGLFNPKGFNIKPKSALLAVEANTATITLNDNCAMIQNDNQNGGDNSGNTGPNDKREVRTGGGVYSAGTLVMNHSTIEDNKCLTNGGGVFVKSGTVTMANCEVGTDNEAVNNGGGLYVNTGGILNLNDQNEVINNIAQCGGGIYINMETAGNTSTYGTVTLNGENIIMHNIASTLKGGGGVYKLGTLQVEGLVTITDNKAGATQEVNNVYIPTNSADDQTILITGELACGSSIGVTKTKTDHTYDDDDNFSQVRTAIAKNEVNNSGHALTAFNRNVFFDDTGKYGVWCMNYQKGGNLSDPKAYSVENDYFIETWRSFAANTSNDVEMSGDKVTQVKTAAGLAYFAKTVNSGLDYASLQTYLVADIDLAGHYWEPIGFSTGSTCDPVTDYKFSGNFDGQGHLIRNAISILPAKTMGLFGNVDGGSVIRTFNIGADFNGTFNGETHIGGIAGQVTGSSPLIDRCEAQGSMQRYGNAAANTGGIAGNVASGEARNSFAVSSNLSGTTVGGLVGKNAGSVKNAYAVNNTLPGSGTVGALVGNNTGTLSNAYTDASSGKKVVGSGSGTNVYSAGATGATAIYTPTIGADQLGYMYADNLVGTTPLFELLNTNAETLNGKATENTPGYRTYDRWARPALAYYVDNGSKAVSIERPINGDLPVLMMNNYGGADNKVGQGGFRAVSTVSVQNEGNNGNFNGYVLQYSGPTRDETGNTPSYTSCPEIDGMLARSTASDSHFIYGDVSKAPSLDITANRISIYEHAAITKAGTLGSFDKTHVSITFDNSAGGLANASTLNINNLPAQFLPRNWHLLSTPLLDASTGFNYKGQNSNTYVSGQDYSASGYFNNPWAGGDASNPGGNEFGWLGGGNNRYWMTGWTGSQNVTLNVYPSLTDWTDGYFPSAVESTVTNFSLNQGCIPTADENGRYPYGMDFYSWTEPNYHYINFKRNGPNHWHSDPNANGEHDHLAYKPEIASNYASPHENVNEEILLAGKGYFASIAEKTLLQSSGQLGTNTKTIEVTCSTYPNTVPLETGWNLVGNPFHAYLDFDKFAKTTAEYTSPNNEKISDNTYIVYNADGFGSHEDGDYGDGFSYYVASGSNNGAYASRYLHPHQGFFVKMGSNETLTFSEDMTVLRSQIGTSGSYRDDSRPAYPLVNLFLTSDKGCSDVCVVEFNRPEWGGATKLRDMYSGNGLFYAAHDNGNYAALFATPEAERIPLKFEAKDEAGDTYTIHWNTQNGDFHKLYLVDNITGVQYDMLRNSSYSFSGKKDDYWTRFYITFEVTGLEEEQDEDDDASTGSASTTFAFFDGSQWVVTNDGHGTATLDLIDLQGRVLHSTTLAEGQARIGLPDVAKGMYLMRMTNQNGMFVQKIVVK